MIRRLVTFSLAAATLAASGAWAQQATAVGVWKTIDDETGKPKSLVRISESNGELRGKIEKLFREAGEEQNPKCDKCEGSLKDQPILGMTIITGMKKDGDEYNGGQILDPANGKVYRSKMSVIDGGKKLDVRGYIGVPLLGRTQTWIRAE
ncbi:MULTISPECIES: DUF2147 domain-containing protein [Oxalobacteraceae]|jgi:uncharacterized protein (DUF2147 family)|uniref:DUF2147 domain-containing protein n=1 Tax=Oxalobacteraceae TaxID=75682 RepID=UPI0010A2AADF|nr:MULTISPECIES: DUF2147 domain-containing protein [Oxalobacteraceae]HJV81141.1 DUF2147 domain-containing protein [Noviherbaspirillum sp.]